MHTICIMPIPGTHHVIMAGTHRVAMAGAHRVAMAGAHCEDSRAILLLITIITEFLAKNSE